MQILTIMDCMHPTSLAKGCCVIQEGDDGSTVYVLEGKAGSRPCTLLVSQHQAQGGFKNIFIIFILNLSIFLVACQQQHQLAL